MSMYSYIEFLWQSIVHGPKKNNLNLGKKAVSVMVGADATILVWFLGQNATKISQIFVCMLQLHKSVRCLCMLHKSVRCLCMLHKSVRWLCVIVCYTNQSDVCVYATQIRQMFVCILHKSVRYLCMPHKSVEASAPAMSGSVWIRNSDHFWDSLVWNLITFRNAVCSYVIKLWISIFKLYWK